MYCKTKICYYDIYNLREAVFKNATILVVVEVTTSWMGAKETKWHEFVFSFSHMFLHLLFHIISVCDLIVIAIIAILNSFTDWACVADLEVI